MKTANKRIRIHVAAILLLTVITAAQFTGCSKKNGTKVPTVDADTFMAQCEESLGWTRSYTLTAEPGQYYYCSDRVQLEPNQVTYFVGSDSSTFIVRTEYTDTASAAAAFDEDYNTVIQKAAMAGTHDEEYDLDKTDNYGYVVVKPDSAESLIYYTLHVYFRDNVYVYMVVYGSDSSSVNKVSDLCDELGYPD